MTTTKHGDNRSIRVLPFLDSYEKQETLWNPSLDSYKNKAARDEAYLNIIKELNIPYLTIHDVKLKVKSIRTTYTKELRLLTKQKEEGKAYSPKLFWFNRANTFLKNVSLSRDKRSNFTEKICDSGDCKPCIIDYITNVSHRQSLEDEVPDNMSNVEVNPDNNSTSTYEYKSLNTVDLDSHIQEDMNLTNERIEEELPSTKHAQTPEEYQSHIANTVVSRKFTNTGTTNSTACSQNVTVDAQNTSNNSNDRNDEYDIFCSSVAAQLRSITDAYSRSVVKLKIQHILFEAETGHYRKSSCITFPSVSI